MSMQNIPVIDIAYLDDAATLAELDAACRDWGFFQVVNHGLDNRVIDRLMNEARSFFRVPLAAKRAIARTSENPWGFYDQELTKNTPDWKEIYDYGPEHGDTMQPQWPSGRPHFKQAVLDYYDACETLAFRLLSAISVNLRVAPKRLVADFEPAHTSFVRLNYYPTCPTPERPEGLSTPTSGHLALNHHSDAGTLTLLQQDDQPGLEVFRDGEWHLVEPRRGALVINIGDMVQVWSNDRYTAALHRVTASRDAERFSAPFFFNPAYTTQYAPLPTTVDARHPPRYRPINWGEFRSKRTAGDYADYGDEVQISHYLR